MTNQNTRNEPDTLFSSPLDRVNDFEFDEAVARVFPDMIKRSVPGYTTIIPMIGLITEHYAQDNSICYDLGCSLGASTLAMRHGLKDKNARIVGIDNSESMIERCQHYIELDNEAAPIDLVCEDIRKVDLKPCSVVTLNFTLQFLPSEDRLSLLTDVYDALLPGGALILSEKVHFDNSIEQDQQQELHWLFKKANGYSELEVSQKRNAIENVLITDSLDTQLSRLAEAGFEQCFTWYQCFNFTSIIAIKSPIA